MAVQVVGSKLGLFWEEGYKKELVHEIRELVKKMEKGDSVELVELIPKAIATLVKLYDWSLGGEKDDYEVLSELVTEVTKEYLKMNQDEIENFIEELEIRLK